MLAYICILKNQNWMVFDVTLTSQPIWKLKSTVVQLQNSFFMLKFLSLLHTSSKYSVKQRTHEQLCVEQTSKIWRKNIHVFLRNCSFRVGAFYFDAPCSLLECLFCCLTATAAVWKTSCNYSERYSPVHYYRNWHKCLTFLSLSGIKPAVRPDWRQLLS